MIYNLIQNPMMLNIMTNILNSLTYNPMIMNDIKNMMNLDLNMMNMNISNILQEKAVKSQRIANLKVLIFQRKISILMNIIRIYFKVRFQKRILIYK